MPPNDSKAGMALGVMASALPISLLSLACLLVACRPAPSDSGSFRAGSSRPESGPWFEDITEQSGVRFIQRAGTNYFMPEQMGSGIAVFDFDQDGRMDLLLLQHTDATTASEARHQLYRQQPDGTFLDVSSGSGLDLRSRAMGVAAGDLNNDGLPDLVIAEYLGSKVFQNLGQGRFQDVTRESGVDNPFWAATASLMDYNRDGRLDLVIGNYLDLDPTQLCRDSRGQRDFCSPSSFGPLPTRLWRNTTVKAGAPIRFSDESERAGLLGARGAALGMVCADFDGDRWPDIFCADDGRPNRLFINRRDGTFLEEAVPRGLALNAMGQTAANMGTAYGDFDRDGLADLFVTHLSDELHGLWRQETRGLYAERLATTGLQQQAWRGTGFGTVAADFDWDGDLDLALVNGLVRHSLPGQTPLQSGTAAFWGRYAQRPQLFMNLGRGSFADRSSEHPSFCGQAMVGRSLASADLNQDGAMDLIVSPVGGPVRIYRGIKPPTGHWLRLRLLEPNSGSRDAIGAEVSIRCSQGSWIQVLQPATGYFSSHEPTLHFGLGAVASVESMEVIWADGSLESFPGSAADRTLVLRRGTGRTLPPQLPAR
ncbi:MAG: CRTAC1 family protein [Verrucomicrobiales bacterium]|nr:CRTAC1 family protein [Verrucomicrobiales bacterium]